MASKGNRRGGFASIERHPKASSIAASISAILKGWPETLVTGQGIDQILVAEQGLELALVHFRHDDLVIRL